MRELLRTIRDDFSANSGPFTRAFLVFFRIGQVLRAAVKSPGIIGRLMFPVLLVWTALYRLLCHSFGCYMPFSVRLGRSPQFRHGVYGVFISHGAVVGDRLTILHHVTIGSNVDAAQAMSPTLGDDVFVGVGAAIIGPVRIGNGCKIGANATVVDDVPDGCTAVSPKAKVLPRRTD